MKEKARAMMYMIGEIWNVYDPDWKIRTAEAYVVNPLICFATLYYAAKGNTVSYCAALAAGLIHVGATYIMCKADDVYLDEEWKKEVERLKKEGKII